MRRSLILFFLVVLAAAPVAASDSAWGRPIPWREAGLSERQAAAFLLDRFAYGARPGDVDAMLELGLGNWFEGQLVGDLPGALLTSKLARLPAVELPPRDIVFRFSRNRAHLVREAIAQGIITRDDYVGNNGEGNLRRAMARLDRLAVDRGMQPDTKLLAQLRAQKLLRAVYSESQLVEVLTDFWLNHFNVSANDSASRVRLLSYERDAIRPHVLGSFRELLGATARHAAMLTYLDNARSAAPEGARTTFDLEVSELDRLSPLENPTLRRKLSLALDWRTARRRWAASLPRGLNENYARELLELHTVGLHGGYTQRDVIEVARAFSGWTTFPIGGARAKIERALVGSDIAATAADMGFVVEGEFVFRADRHDAGEKIVLGVTLPAGRGIEDGEEVLDLLAGHRATAHRLAHKLAVRFVSENPPRALVHRLTDAWEITGGDLREVMRTLVASPELWAAAGRREKIKTPFELAASALRALEADLVNADVLINWIARMGQPLYGYGAPTGFPDRGESWVQVGPLLTRVNFGLALARGRIDGIRVDLAPALGKQRVESVDDAARLFFPRLLPGRDASSTLGWLAAAEPRPEKPPRPTSNKPRDPQAELAARKQALKHATYAVGVLLGSPEFQVR